MKEFFPVLHTAALFSGISDEELAAMLSCLGARIDVFPKGSRLLRAGGMIRAHVDPVKNTNSAVEKWHKILK